MTGSATSLPRLAETFPTLSAPQIARMRAVGTERAFHAGEILFEQGEASTKFLVVLVGSRHSSGTLRVKEFLTRNGHPHSTIDVDHDPAAQALLDQFGVGIADVPIVICRNVRVLKNPSNEELADCLGYTSVLDAT